MTSHVLRKMTLNNGISEMSDFFEIQEVYGNAGICLMMRLSSEQSYFAWQNGKSVGPADNDDFVKRNSNRSQVTF